MAIQKVKWTFWCIWCILLFWI